jgi:hypothetical protein
VAREAWGVGRGRRVPNAFPSEAVPSVSFVRAKGGSLIRARESRQDGEAEREGHYRTSHTASVNA